MVNKTARLRENEEFVITPALLIGRILTFYRFKAGVSQKELGAKLNIAQRTVSKLEYDGATKKIMKDKTLLFKIDRALGYNVGTINGLRKYIESLNVLPEKINSKDLFTLITNLEFYREPSRRVKIQREFLEQLNVIVSSFDLSDVVIRSLKRWCMNTLQDKDKARRYSRYFTNANDYKLQSLLDFYTNKIIFKIYDKDEELVLQIHKDFKLNSSLKIVYFNGDSAC